LPPTIARSRARQIEWELGWWGLRWFCHTVILAGARASASSRKSGTPTGPPSKRGSTVRYRVYSGSRGSEDIAPLAKVKVLFKEFTTIDDALSWARHLE